LTMTTTQTLKTSSERTTSNLKKNGRCLSVIKMLKKKLWTVVAKKLNELMKGITGSSLTGPDYD